MGIPRGDDNLVGVAQASHRETEFVGNSHWFSMSLRDPDSVL